MQVNCPIVKTRMGGIRNTLRCRDSSDDCDFAKLRFQNKLKRYAKTSKIFYYLDRIAGK
jgi:hypothetical protein